MATRIRPATAADVPFVAWVMLAASRSHLPFGAWDHYVDGNEARVLSLLERMAAQDEPSFCRWERFLVAEVDGTPAAALSGYTTRDPGLRDPGPALAAASRAALGWDERAMRAGGDRLATFLTCVSEPAPETWAVEWVATRPEYRRRGLVHDLLPAIMQRGRDLGFRESQIMVLLGNTPAQRAYERAGYRVVEEKRDPEFQRVMGCPGIACMTRSL
jgi:ribosomal protein S18 acetylase RimI-like enzyme